MKLLIVDDHPLVREGLVSMFSNENNICEVREAGNLREALSILSKEKPDIAMVDLKLGCDSGLEVIAEGKKLSENTKYIMLTSYISKENFLKAEKMGLDGYILKEAFAEDILYAINVVSRGKKYYDPGIMEYLEKSNHNNITDKLTEREKEVFEELGQGLSNEEIAKQLFISENTVKKHVSSILSKLNINHRAQVVLVVNNRLTL